MSRATPFAVATTVAGALVLVAGLVAINRALSEERVAAPAIVHPSPTSYAGKGPANAAGRAKAHEPYPAALPPIPDGDVVQVRMVMTDKAVEIAPGVFYNVWAFDGALSAPGPIVHVREGQTVEMTLVNGGAIAHSIDFHAARIAPNVAFRDVQLGEAFTFRFRASDPGVFMYHCGTKPVLAHIANGMYGAIVVSPAQPQRHAKERSHLRVVGGEPDRAGVGRDVIDSYGGGLVDDGAEETQPARFVADRRTLRGVQPERDEPLETPSPSEHAERRIPRARKRGGCLQEFLEDRVELRLRSESDPRLNERLLPSVVAHTPILPCPTAQRRGRIGQTSRRWARTGNFLSLARPPPCSGS